MCVFKCFVYRQEIKLIRRLYWFDPTSPTSIIAQRSTLRTYNFGIESNAMGFSEIPKDRRVNFLDIISVFMLA